MPERAESNKLYKICFIICEHWMFNLLITLLIVANTGVLALDQYPRNIKLEETASILNDLFSWCFAAEMIIKLIGLGLKRYTRDTFNIFDALLVIISLVDFVLLHIPEFSAGGSGGALSAFRGVRLLRVFKLARSWTSFRELLQTMVKTVKEIIPFSSLLGICMFIFSLLGMELFGYRVRFDKNE